MGLQQTKDSSSQPTILARRPPVGGPRLRQDVRVNFTQLTALLELPLPGTPGLKHNYSELLRLGTQSMFEHQVACARLALPAQSPQTTTCALSMPSG